MLGVCCLGADDFRLRAATVPRDRVPLLAATPLVVLGRAPGFETVGFLTGPFLEAGVFVTAAWLSWLKMSAKAQMNWRGRKFVVYLKKKGAGVLPPAPEFKR